MRITMGKEYSYTVIAKKFENRTKNTKDIGKYVKYIKIAKNLLKDSPTAMDFLLVVMLLDNRCLLCFIGSEKFMYPPFQCLSMSNIIF